MASLIGCQLRRALHKPGDRFNIISFSCHETYQTSLVNTNADYYLFSFNGGKEWESKYRQLPKNHTILDKNLGDKQIPIDLEFDAVLVQNREAHYGISFNIAKTLQIPLILLEHCACPNNNKTYLEQYKACKGHKYLFISEFSRNSWNYSENEAEIIEHGMDDKVFKPSRKERKKHILTVANDYINRDYCLNFQGYQRITKDLPVFPVGDTRGFSQPAKNLFELVGFYQTSEIFLNTATLSPIPCSLLEAALSECAIVSTRNPLIDKTFQHGVSAFLTNDERESRKYLEELLQNSDLARKMGAEARKAVQKHFSLAAFTENWNRIFEEVAQIKFNQWK